MRKRTVEKNCYCGAEKIICALVGEMLRLYVNKI